MNATEVIDTYVGDTVRLLPSRLRADVATELRCLLNEELIARSRESECLPDESLAIALVRGYGLPNEVAARYQPPRAIIDPADTTSFLRAAIIGGCALVLMNALSRLRPSPSGTADVLVLAWLGLLVVFFGGKARVRRRWPSKAVWKPRDRDRANRLGTAFVIPIATIVTALYATPGPVLDLMTRGRLNTSWAAYTADFEQLRLPVFIGLMVGNIVLLGFSALRGQWTRLTRRISIAINLALACLILSFAIDGHVFESSTVDQIAREILALVAVGYVPILGILLYDEIGRLDRAAVPRKGARQYREPHPSA